MKTESKQKAVYHFKIKVKIFMDYQRLEKKNFITISQWSVLAPVSQFSHSLSVSASAGEVL
jgi:hypothetical protein